MGGSHKRLFDDDEKEENEEEDDVYMYPIDMNLDKRVVHPKLVNGIDNKKKSL